MEDMISRKAAIECLEHLSACDEPFVEIGTGDETFIGKYEAITEISDLPSAPQRTGRWIEDDDEMFVICSECGEKNDYISAFCPDCGARMEESEE